MESIKIICPDCSKFLRLMYYYHQDDLIIALYTCEDCKNGIDSDWRVTYSKEKGIEKIERYFFG